MAFTQISTTNIKENTVVSYAEYAAFTANVLPKISSVQYADATFTALDDTAANTSGTARLVINGSGFQTGATVIVGTTSASSTARVSAEQLRANVSALSAGSYALYVQNPDGGTAIRVSGVTFSNTPVWGTASLLTNQLANTSFNVSISATSDSNITYSNTTVLPAGTTLLANGYFYGNVSVGVETNYTFTVKANDVENQDASREFSLTITLAPTYSLYMWGYNAAGALGLNDTVDRSSPVQVGTQKWKFIAQCSRNNGSWQAAGGIDKDGALWLWGDNYYGKLGLNDQINRSSPVQVGSLTNWKKLGIMTYFPSTTVALKEDGTIWSWGGATYGALGLNVFERKSSPTQIGTNTDWSDISTGQAHTLAIKTDGTLWTWGHNYLGALGLDLRANQLYAKSSPTQIGVATNWSKVMVSDYSNMALKTNNTLWSWGGGAGNLTGAGRLGLNSNADRSSPTQIGTETNWTANVCTGSSHTMAVKSDGTLWAWGGGGYGALGLNATNYVSSPIQVGSDTTWRDVKVTGDHTIATKTNGTLWTWGYNTYGVLGIPGSPNKSSPTQVGTATDWNQISVVGPYASMATKQT